MNAGSRRNAGESLIPPTRENKGGPGGPAAQGGVCITVRFSLSAALFAVAALTAPPATGATDSYTLGNGVITFFPSTVSADLEGNYGGVRFFFSGAQKVNVTVNATDGLAAGFSADFYDAHGTFLGAVRGCGEKKNIGIPFEARELTVLVGAYWSILHDCPGNGVEGSVTAVFR